MTQFPDQMLIPPLHVQRGTPTGGEVGEGRHSSGAPVGSCAWLQEQHARDLLTLDRIERQLEELRFA